MPAHVVDALEAVEVDDEQRERLGRPLGARERLLDAVVEQRSVREAGQRVPESESLRRQRRETRRFATVAPKNAKAATSIAAASGRPSSARCMPRAGAEGDHESGGRRPDQPSAYRVPGEGLAHVRFVCARTPGAGAAPQYPDRRGDRAAASPPTWELHPPVRGEDPPSRGESRGVRLRLAAALTWVGLAVACLAVFGVTSRPS